MLTTSPDLVSTRFDSLSQSLIAGNGPSVDQMKCAIYSLYNSILDEYEMLIVQPALCFCSELLRSRLAKS
jgi:hypothetical protein